MLGRMKTVDNLTTSIIETAQADQLYQFFPLVFEPVLCGLQKVC